jgi:dUTP pyrophosphatase
MQVKVKRLSEDAVIPMYGKPGDAGMDLTATSRHFDSDGNVVYGTDLAFEIPEGFVGLLFPRSSNAKKDLTLTNSVGVIDSGYRGEVSFKFKPAAFFAEDSWENPGDKDIKSYWFDYTMLPKGQNQDSDNYGCELYKIGDRIGQIIIMPYPQVTFEEVSELSSTERGEGSFGSTGK